MERAEHYGSDNGAERSTTVRLFEVRTVHETGMWALHGSVPIEVERELNGLFLPVKGTNPDGDESAPTSIRVSTRDISTAYTVAGNEGLARWWGEYTDLHSTQGNGQPADDAEILLPFSSGYLHSMEIPNEV